MSGFRILGAVLAVLGVVASIFPSWFGFLTRWPEAPVQIQEAIESRVRGGMLLGVVDSYVAALSDWVENGAASEHAFSDVELGEALRTQDAARARAPLGRPHEDPHRSGEPLDHRPALAHRHPQAQGQHLGQAQQARCGPRGPGPWEPIRTQ